MVAWSRGLLPLAAATFFQWPCAAATTQLDTCSDGTDDTCGLGVEDDVEAQEMKQVLLQRRATVATGSDSDESSLAATDSKADEVAGVNTSEDSEEQWHMKCSDYEKKKGCKWTETWSCPGQHTAHTKGHARHDKSTGYYCCCKMEGWKKLPSASTPAPTAATVVTAPAATTAKEKCAAYIKDEGCEWTRTWSCPGQEVDTAKGHARKDGTLGYECCCENKMWEQLPTPAPTPAPPPGSYWSTGHHKNMTVYHQTSPEVCKLIMQSNFIIGKGGLCGKAVYFAKTPQATSTKAITAGSHGGCMIEAIVDVGKTGRYLPSDGGRLGYREGQKEKPCGRYSSMTAKTLHDKGYDTIVMRRGDGDEVIVFEPERILEKKIMHFDCKWMCKGRCQKHWPSHCHHWR